MNADSDFEEGVRQAGRGTARSLGSVAGKGWIAPTRGGTLRAYLRRGLRFGRFVSLEDSDALAQVARRVAAPLPPGMILDLGCGAGMPLLHACGMRHWGLGIDCDGEALLVARANAAKARRSRVIFVEADFCAASGRFALVMSNPPYIPCDPNCAYDRALEVPGDGTGAIQALLGRYGTMTERFVLHFSSICNPTAVFGYTRALGLDLVTADLTVSRFGNYTSDPTRFSHLLECRKAGRAQFFTECRDGGGPAECSQLLLTIYCARGSTAGNSDGIGGREEHVIEAVNSFAMYGTRGIREASFGRRGRWLRVVRYADPTSSE